MADEEIQYANNYDEWPDKELWGDAETPPDEERCQFRTLYGAYRCGFPRYRGKGENARCVFHYDGEDRDNDDLRNQLQEAMPPGPRSALVKVPRPIVPHPPTPYFEHAQLSNADLSCLDLSGTNFRDADFSGANLSDSWLEECCLAGARFTDGCDLRNAKLSGATLRGATISQDAKLEGVEWGKEDIIHDERKVREQTDRARRSEAFRACANAYRQIKQAYQHSGDYQRAGCFFVREMECLRCQIAQEIPQRWWKFPVWWIGRAGRCLSWFLFQHAEDPWRLAGIMLLTILGFAGLHGLFGIQNADGTPAIAIGWEISPDLCITQGIWRAIYFSVVTFTSLGYGDFKPSYAGSYVATIETTLGVIFIALFVGSIIRKLSR